MREKFKVLIIDNMPLVHIALKGMIESGWKGVSFLETGVQLEEIKGEPDIIILGTISPNKAYGVNYLKQLRVKFRSARILLFTHLDEYYYGISYLKAGAQGYLSRSANKEKIMLAIEMVLRGEHFFCSDELKDKLFDDFLFGGLKIKGKQDRRMIQP